MHTKVKPVVSILILTYNRIDVSSKFIPKILDKIGPIPNEILIWDNGSEDGTFDWIYTFGQADNRITKVFGSDKNIGMEGTNYMAQEARGKYIIKVDDDITVPHDFAKRLVDAYETANEEKLLFLAWDMPWKGGTNAVGSTFATRSGLTLYKDTKGKTIQISQKEHVLINYNPDEWMVNGACRLSPRETFLEIGGHPKGIIYGVDRHVSRVAHQHGYWIGFFSSEDLIVHEGVSDKDGYRKMKDEELRRVGSPKHV
jgi:GT2 family glycosyltransferase